MSVAMRNEIQLRRTPAPGAIGLSLVAHAVVIAFVLHPWHAVVEAPLPAVEVTLVSAPPDEVEDRSRQSTVARQDQIQPSEQVSAPTPVVANSTAVRKAAPEAPPVPPVKPIASIENQPEVTTHEFDNALRPADRRPSRAPLYTPPETRLATAPEKSESPSSQQAERQARDTSALLVKLETPLQPVVHGPLIDAGLIADLQPEYPLLARRRGYQGRVVVAANVLSSGEVEFASLVASSGYDMLDDAALDAVRAWRLLPARKNGEAVDGRIEIPFNFVLQ
jgi:periplasmic protein TonB